MAKNPNPKLDEEPKQEAQSEDATVSEKAPQAAVEKPIAAHEPYPTGSAEVDHDAEFFAAHGFHREGSKAAEDEKAAQEKAARAAAAAAAKEEDR